LLAIGRIHLGIDLTGTYALDTNTSGMSPSAPTIDNASACVRKPTAYPSDRRRGGGSDALEPHAGRAVINAGAVTFYSVVDDYIFRARSAIGDADADRWRHSARTAYWRIGAAVDSKLSLSLCPTPSPATRARTSGKPTPGTDRRS
jgi:hypothetical protein